MSDGLDALRDLVHDLTMAGPVSMEKAKAVVSRGALNIKNEWREGVSGLAHAPALPYALSYDTTARRGVIEAEIGFDKDKPQGALGNLIEFGSVQNPPHADGQKALDREEPRFVSAMEDVAGEVLQ